ncbi:MAG: cysteine desulfurase [Hyphomicrobiaceae bacterium]|nr:cysteine desulfurase [Hyphomicrobiaceae bacterium]
MNAARTYLDANATAPLRPVARNAVLAAMEQLGNPSSVHTEGRTARRIIEDARERVAALAGARPSEVVFTSGATEANNAAIAGGWDAIITSGIEHDAVLAPARARGAHLVEVPAGGDGVVDAGAVATALLSDPIVRGRVLVSVQMANNETGVVQPVAEIADFARAHGALVHTDAVQAAGRVPLSFADLGVDLMALSAHKIGGPFGVGALVVRDGFDLKRWIVGGGQERRRRAGTENVAAIAGFGAAAEAARNELAAMRRIADLRDRLEAGVRASTPDAVIIAQGSLRLPNTSAVAWPGQSAETLVIKLDLAGIAVSAGSACSSGKVGSSHVLQAMGLAPEIARSAIRVSLGWQSSEADIEAFLQAWRALASSQSRAVA